jgi:hypothetical protein
MHKGPTRIHGKTQSAVVSSGLKICTAIDQIEEMESRSAWPKVDERHSDVSEVGSTKVNTAAVVRKSGTMIGRGEWVTQAPAKKKLKKKTAQQKSDSTWIRYLDDWKRSSSNMALLPRHS